MDFVKSMLPVDFFIAAVVIYLVVFLRATDTFDQDLNRRIRKTLGLLLFQALADNLAAIFIPQAAPVGKAMMLIAYTARVCLLTMLTAMMQRYHVHGKELRILAIPAVVNAVFMLSGLFHDAVLRVDAGGVIQRGPLMWAHYLASGAVFIRMWRFLIRQGRRGHPEDTPILGLGIGLLICSLIIEGAAGLRGIFCGATAMAVTFYYLHLYVDSAHRDMLTGARTRAAFFADLSKMRPEQVTAFCEFDMNNLKEINDIKGHSEGDRAIVEMHDMIEDSIPPAATVYRFGGDEFAVLFHDVNMSTVYGTVYRIRELFSKSEYGCAIGVAEWKEGEPFSQVYTRADEQMYEDKRQQKEKAREKRKAGEGRS